MSQTARTLIALLIVTLMLAATANAAAPNPVIARFVFEEAEAAFASKDYVTALSKLEEAEKKFGMMNPPILYLRIMARDGLLSRSNADFVLIERLRKETSQYLQDYGDIDSIRDQAHEVYRINTRLKQYPATREEFDAKRSEVRAPGLAAGRTLFESLRNDISSYADQAVKLKIQPRAENGEIVPVTVEVIRSSGNVWVFVDSNDDPVAVRANFKEGSTLPIELSTRVRMQRSGNIIAAHVDDQGRISATSVPVEVTVGAVARASRGASFTNIAFRGNQQALKMLLQSPMTSNAYISHIAVGDRIEISASSNLSLNPYFHVKTDQSRFDLIITGNDGKRETHAVTMQ